MNVKFLLFFFLQVIYFIGHRYYNTHTHIYSYILLCITIIKYIHTKNVYYNRAKTTLTIYRTLLYNAIYLYIACE